MTKYCKICAFCTKEGEYYHCAFHNRTKTERQICHTTNCHQFVESKDGIDLVTERKYRPHRRKDYQAELFTVERRPTFWERLKEFGRRFEALKHHG